MWPFKQKSISHADAPVKTRAIPELRETAAHARDLDIASGFIGRTLPNMDKIVRYESSDQSVRVYHKLMHDAHVESVTSVRAAAVVAREWRVEPGDDSSEAQRMADFVSQVIGQIDLFDQFRRLVLARGTVIGFSPAEILWEYSEGDVWINKILHRQEYRFKFGAGGEMFLLTKDNRVEGEELPPRKFVVYNYPGTDNPYGDGLGQKLYWWELFKRYDIRNWVQFNERFGDPTVIGKYPTEISPADRTNLETVLDEGVQRQSSILIPEDVEIELLEAQRYGSVSSFEKLSRFCDKQISKAVLGQTLTSDSGEVGSYALGQVHNLVREDLRDMDIDLESYCHNAGWIRWLTDYNFGAQPRGRYPRLWIEKQDPEDLDKRILRDKIIYDMGKKYPGRYFEEEFGVL